MVVTHDALPHIHRLSDIYDFKKINDIFFLVILAAINHIYTAPFRNVFFVSFQPISFK